MSDVLWAPWRMEYLLGSKGGPCVFCDMAAAPPEAYRSKLVLMVAAHALVCLNKYPFAAGHLLIVPRRHAADLAELEDGEYDATMRLVRATVARVQRGTGAQGVNLGMNLGGAAGGGRGHRGASPRSRRSPLAWRHQLHARRCGRARDAGIPRRDVEDARAAVRRPARRASGRVGPRERR